MVANALSKSFEKSNEEIIYSQSLEGTLVSYLTLFAPIYSLLKAIRKEIKKSKPLQVLYDPIKNEPNSLVGFTIQNGFIKFSHERTLCL